MREKNTQSEGTLQSVQNALRILDMLQRRPTIKAASVGEELGLGRSTVHRLLATLEQEGFVQRDRVQHNYRAGRALIALGIAAVGDLDIRKRARAYLEELAASTRETAHLFILEGPNTRIIDSAEGTHPVRVGADTGAIMPAHATAGGKALLAALPSRELHTLYPRGLPSLTKNTITKWDIFENDLDAVRKRGYALNHGESDISVSGIAVPIVDRGRRLVASLALSIPSGRLTDDRAVGLAAELRQQARRIVDTLI